MDPLPNPSWRRLLLIAALAAGAGTAAAQDLYRDRGAWVDEQAQPQQLQALRGRHVVLTLAYGACRRVCSTSLRLMERLQALADERGVSLEFVVVGLDPAQDKPADWADFRQERKLTRPNWHFLTSDEATTRALARRLGVRVWRIDSHLMHDFRIALLSPQGTVMRTLDQFDQPLATLLP